MEYNGLALGRRRFRILWDPSYVLAQQVFFNFFIIGIYF